MFSSIKQNIVISKNLGSFCFLLLIITLNFYSLDAYSQNNKRSRELKPEGTEFWLVFMKNFHDEDERRKNPLLLQLFITGDKDANVNIEVQSIGFAKKVFVPAGSVISVEIDNRVHLDRSEIVLQKHAIHVTSDNPVSVYGLNRRRQTTDTYLGLPSNVLGTEYRAMCYDYSEGLMPLFAIVATDDGTIVTIAPTVETAMGKPAGKPFTVMLDKGDVYQVISKFDMLSPKKCDLTGTLVTSNKKIAFFSGHQCAYVPQTIIACNHLAEQIPPVNSWGKHFYIGELKPRSGYNYRVLAHYDSTKVFEDEQYLGMLRAGEFLERAPRKNIQLTTDKPALVSQFSQGFDNRDSIGDPMMILISPTQQFLTDYRFATPVNGFWRHYINVVAPTNSISTIRLNNNPVDTLKFQRLGLSRYSIAHLEVPFGTHTLTGDLPLAMYSYGFGFGDDAYDAYGAMGGQSFYDYEPAKDEHPPVFELHPEGRRARIIVRDDWMDDTGLKRFSVISAEGLILAPFQLFESSPILSTYIEPTGIGSSGRLAVVATDVAGNKSFAVICYYYDPATNRFEYYISDNPDHECRFDPGILAGLYGIANNTSHSPDFNNFNFLKPGKFESPSSSWGRGFGVSATRKIANKINLTARFSLESIGGELNSPDFQIDSVRNPGNGNLEPFQEEYILSIEAFLLHFSISAEWLFYRNFYLFGGLGYSMPISKAVSFKRSIMIPEDRSYSDGARIKALPELPQSLEEMQAPGISLVAGAGWNFPISFRWSGFIEGCYRLNTGSLIESGSWGVAGAVFNFGIRYKLYF